eukprot:scaffold13160_cov106-Isochrysis_galbana.AAC.9
MLPEVDHFTTHKWSVISDTAGRLASAHHPAMPLTPPLQPSAPPQLSPAPPPGLRAPNSHPARQPPWTRAALPPPPP